MTEKTLHDVLDGLTFAMVATSDPSHGGTWKSRPLALAGQDGPVLSFLVGADADWVEGLETADSPATVTFSDQSKNVWVALQGNARTRNDRQKIAELWNVGAGSYFDGKDDPKVRVFEFTVDYGDSHHSP
jgi:general stress protein 26